MLDDFAALARAALALFEATGEPPYLEAATSTASQAQILFGAEDGGLYLTAADATDAPSVRARLSHDGATPSGVGLMAEVFARLYHLTNETGWRDAAERLIRAFSGVPAQELPQSPLLLAAADMLTRGGCILVEGRLDDPAAIALAEVALAAPDPVLTVLRLYRSLWPNGAPGDRPALPDTPAAMMCRGSVCGLPVRQAEGLRAELGMRLDGA
jgi:uncharacterized protein YyaL (SSP411 family)